MPSDKLAALLEQIPGPDNHSLSSVAEVDKLQHALEPLLAGDADLLRELVAQLREPAASDAADQKARYVLHIAAVQAHGGDRAEARRKLTEVFAAELAGDAPLGAKKYLVRELQVCGDGEAAPALGKLLTHDDVELADTAAQALVAIGAGAAEQFRAALKAAKGTQRITIVQNLGVLKDGESSAALQALLDDDDQELRLATACALANIGAASTAEAMIRMAGKETGYARAVADGACLQLAEQLNARGDKAAARKTYERFVELRKDPADDHVRSAAQRGLAAVGQ